MNVTCDKKVTVVINKVTRREVTINAETRISDIRAILALPDTYRISLTRNGDILAPSTPLFPRIHNHGRLYARSDEQMVQLTLDFDKAKASTQTCVYQLETPGTFS